MLFREPLRFIKEFVGKINDALGKYKENCRLSSTQQFRISFCLTAIIMTDTVCRAESERAGLGRYALAALSRMLRRSGIAWEFMLCSSVSHMITPTVTIPVGFGFCMPDPKLTEWYKLKKQKVGNCPEKPKKNPDYLL